MGKTVAVLFGGPSNEHEISCLSAKTVLKALTQAGHQVLPIAVDPDLTWRYIPTAIAQLEGIKDRLPQTQDLAGDKVNEIKADVAFPVLHGAWGEDGGVQQALSNLNLPYVGSGISASKLAMDKSATKAKLSNTSVKVLPGITVDKSNWQSLLVDMKKLGGDLFVKPCHGGSSLGVTHVKSESELISALELVFDMSDQALVELALDKPREIEIGVLQNPTGSLEVSVCGEIKLKPEFDFYDYQAKYLADGAELIVPAEIAPEKYQEFYEMAKQAFSLLGCGGLARVDFLMAQDGTVYLNEVNTMPGFTQISMYPKMFGATGIELPELVDRLINHAISVSREEDLSDV